MATNRGDESNESTGATRRRLGNNPSGELFIVGGKPVHASRANGA
jgi:hypothetical protein